MRDVLINESMAKTYWPGTSAIGRRLRLSSEAGWLTVIGVVRDITIPSTGNRKSSTSSYQMYFPFAREFESATVILRTTGSATDLTRRLTREATAVDAAIRVRDVSTVDALLSKHLAGPRFNMSLLASFAGLALVLATVGLYGVIAYSVSQRTREIGIRLALGASRGVILRWVFGQGMRLTLLGLGAGIVGAFALTRLLRGLLFGVETTDPLTYAGLALLLAAVALLACYIPARRATKVDPMVALRYE